ncbi:MAG: Splicing factor [Trizodia sp. TS-e1964]|nr:MAG: Splicing factor [Trizodia sp. TS-e1964]
MDINSLLSPQVSPASEAPPKAKVAASGPSQKQRYSPLAPAPFPREEALLVPIQGGRNSHFHAHQYFPKTAATQAQQPPRTPPLVSPDGVVQSIRANPPAAKKSSLRRTSTTGMDALADIASKAPPHQSPSSRRPSAVHLQSNGSRSADGNPEVINLDAKCLDITESPLLPNAINYFQNDVPNPPQSSRNSIDANMADASHQTAAAKSYACASLSEADQLLIASTVTYLNDNPYAYDSHVTLITLLHKGFISHINPSETSDEARDPHSYELLTDLRQARESMDSRYPVGEDIWADWISDESLLACTLDERIFVMELCKRAVEQAVGSTRLWLLYGEWVWSLHRSAMMVDFEAEGLAGKWTEEEKIMGTVVFEWKMIISVWTQAVEATKWRINDSRLVWNRYADLMLEDLEEKRTKAKIEKLRSSFGERLKTPHYGWDETFQMFSSFVTKYCNASYEAIMVQTTKSTAAAKAKYTTREPMEMRLQFAIDKGDKRAEWIAFSEYLEWESRPIPRQQVDLGLLNSLYERALIRLGTTAVLWEDYVLFILEKGHWIPPLVVLERATRHCPWSGTLWSQFMLSAEKESRSFHYISAIKHRATATGLLELGGLEESMKVNSAYCLYLKRTAFKASANDEVEDVAEVGFRSAIDHIKEVGQKKFGNDFKGDPKFRIERIYIEYFVQQGNIDSAREVWKGLAEKPYRAASYEFWLSYYQWEMMCWARMTAKMEEMQETIPPPAQATNVLRVALRNTKMDWPERIIEAFINHVEDYEDVDELQTALFEVNVAKKKVARRREVDAYEAKVLAYQQQQLAAMKEAGAPPVPDATTAAKRKRGDEEVEGGATNPKKSRTAPPREFTAPNHVDKEAENAVPKRDRENTTVFVKNLPANVTELRVRQYFRECGVINGLRIDPAKDEKSATAAIEFESKEDVLSALTRDMKMFDGNSIEIQVGSGSTLYVSNYPATADEAFIRNLFNEFGEIIDIRFPSLKYNTHRRFCYVQFKSASDAQKAAQLDGKKVDDLELVAKISDPSQKQHRTGAIHEGREVYVRNVNWQAGEEDIKEVFSKFGVVEKVRIPTKMDGKSKGIAFVVFSTTDAATSSLALNNTNFMSRIINVEISSTKPAKRNATMALPGSAEDHARLPPNGQRSTQTPDTQYSAASPTSVTSKDSSRPSRDEIKSRTVALLNVPDTVNDSRIRAIMEPYGTLTKIVLRPDHRGAIVEFKETNDAGRASLGIEGFELEPGRPLSVGSVTQLLRERPEFRPSRGTAYFSHTPRSGTMAAGKDKNSLLPQAAVRRPVLANTGKAARGGLGVKRRPGLGFRSLAPATEKPATADESTRGGEASVEAGPKSADATAARSNADFKALYAKP